MTGLKGPLSCLNNARLGIAFAVTGAAIACFEGAREYALSRAQFDGKPIAGYQLTQEKLADMLQEIVKAQLLALRLARLKDEGKVTPVMVSLAKRNNVKARWRSPASARSIYGANGITDEYPPVRHMLNLESVFTYEGTHEVHTLVLGKAITGHRRVQLMRSLLGRWLWLLAAGVLAACATIPVSDGESPGCEVAAEAFSFEEPCADESSLRAAVRRWSSAGCTGAGRCRNTFRRGAWCSPGAERLSLPRRRRRRSEVLGERAGAAAGTRSRCSSSRGGHKPPLLPSQQQMLEEAEAERNKPHEKHHIFPQAFRAWFTRKGINIDEYVIPAGAGEAPEHPPGSEWRAVECGVAPVHRCEHQERDEKRRSTGMPGSSSTSSSCSALSCRIWTTAASRCLRGIKEP